MFSTNQAKDMFSSLRRNYSKC